jgi:hypothetical protein
LFGGFAPRLRMETLKFVNDINDGENDDSLWTEESADAA